MKIIEILKRFFKKTKKETVKETIEEIATIEENTKEEKEEEDNTYFNDGELYAEIRIVKDTRKRKRKWKCLVFLYKILKEKNIFLL